MPPCFLGLPLRQMMLPLRGPLPVNSQIRAMAIPFRKNQGAGKVAVRRAKASSISVLDQFDFLVGRAFARAGSSVASPHRSWHHPTVSGQNLQNELGFPRRLPLSFGVWTLTCFIVIGP
jgi:hypothetical protein